MGRIKVLDGTTGFDGFEDIHGMKPRVCSPGYFCKPSALPMALNPVSNQ
jgi:hypothetical protein